MTIHLDKMNILFVVYGFYLKGNGLSASARRTVQKLKEAGENVRVLSAPNTDPDGPQPDYPLKEKHYPIIDGLVTSSGYTFATRPLKVIREALRWADVVHIEEPFNLQRRTVLVAKAMGVPCVATYHLHPENLLSAVRMGRWRLLNDIILWFWRFTVFDFCKDIQCPTKNVSDRLARNGFRSRLHLISNGLIIDGDSPEKDHGADSDEVFNVICVGRLAVEKGQDTLLRAMRCSRYADRIQLTFAGQGPQADSYKRKAEDLYKSGVLRHEPKFVFLDQNGIRELARKADLYIHCATIEVEGLSCLEVLREGVVPVIADGPLSATAQFALDDRSVFPVRDYKSLAMKIDRWLDDKEERHKCEKLYASSVYRYDISRSIDDIRQMYKDAIASMPGRSAS